MPFAKDGSGGVVDDAVGSLTSATTVDDLAEKIVRSLPTPPVDHDGSRLDNPKDSVREGNSANGDDKDGVLDERSYMDQMRDVSSFMCQEPFCIWVSRWKSI